MDKKEIVSMLRRLIADHEASIDELLIERKAVKPGVVRDLIDEQIGHFSRMAQNNREMIEELK